MYEIHYITANSEMSTPNNFRGVDRKYWIKQDGEYHISNGSIIEKNEMSNGEISYQLLPVVNGTTNNIDIEFDITSLTIATNSMCNMSIFTESNETFNITMTSTIVFVPYNFNADLSTAFDIPDVPKVVYNLSCCWMPKAP